MKYIVAAALGCALLVSGCATTPGGTPPTTADIIKQVQQGAVTACGFLPLAATVAAIISTSTIPISAIAGQICAAVTAMPPAGTGLAAGPPRVAGVIIQGRFVR